MASMLLCFDLAPSTHCGQRAQGRGLCVCEAPSVAVAVFVVGIHDVEGRDLRVRKVSAPLLLFGRASLRRPTEPLRGPIGEGDLQSPFDPPGTGSGGCRSRGLVGFASGGAVASSAAFTITWRCLL